MRTYAAGAMRSRQRNRRRIRILALALAAVWVLGPFTPLLACASIAISDTPEVAAAMPCHGSAPQAAASSETPENRKCCKRTDGTCCLDAAALDTTLDTPNNLELPASIPIASLGDTTADRRQERHLPRFVPGPDPGPPPISSVSILRL